MQLEEMLLMHWSFISQSYFFQYLQSQYGIQNGFRIILYVVPVVELLHSPK